MGIKTMDRIYKNKFKQFVYYCWIQHYLVPNCTPWLQKARHHIVHVNRYFNFIPRVCSYTRNFNLILTDFANFYILICYNLTLKDCAEQAYLDLADFLYSWDVYMKEKCFPLIGSQHTPPGCWRFQLKPKVEQ